MTELKCYVCSSPIRENSFDPNELNKEGKVLVCEDCAKQIFLSMAASTSKSVH